jgi:uncharacterized Zn-finger protein
MLNAEYYIIILFKNRNIIENEQMENQQTDTTQQETIQTKRGPQHKCSWEGCDKLYYFKDGVNRHIDAFHRKIKNYSCEICDKSFTQETSLRDHRNLHTGEKPYSCSFPGCIKKFKYKSSLPIHLKKCHGMVSTSQRRSSHNTKVYNI